MNPIETKSIFVYQVPSILNGDPSAFASLLAGGGFESVGFKVADGPYGYGAHVTPELIAAVRAKGIAVWGWGFLYGADPIGEAEIGAERVNALGLDGYVFDVESAYEETPNAVRNVASILAVFQGNLLRQVPTALCSWAFYKSVFSGQVIHNIEVMKAFMEGCNYGMPMQYWQGSEASGAVQYFWDSLLQWQKYTSKPIIPVGRAYNGDGGEVTAEAVSAYEREVRMAGLKGITWWVLDQAQPKYHPDIWAALSAMDGFSGGEPPTGETMIVKAIFKIGIHTEPNATSARVADFAAGQTAEVISQPVERGTTKGVDYEQWVEIAPGRWVAVWYKGQGNGGKLCILEGTPPEPPPPTNGETISAVLTDDQTGEVWKGTLVKQ